MKRTDHSIKPLSNTLPPFFCDEWDNLLCLFMECYKATELETDVICIPLLLWVFP